MQLQTLEAIKGLDDSVATLKGAQALIDTALRAKRQLEDSEFSISQADRKELRRVADARLQFAVENASQILEALIPKNEEDEIEQSLLYKPNLELINDENWITIQSLIRSTPGTLTKLKGTVIGPITAGVFRPDDLRTGDVPKNRIWPYFQPLWYAIIVPFEALTQACLYVSRVFFAFLAQLRRAIGLDWHTRDEWNYHQRQIGVQNRAAKLRVAKIFNSIRTFKF